MQTEVPKYVSGSGFGFRLQLGPAVMFAEMSSTGLRCHPRNFSRAGWGWADGFFEGLNAGIQCGFCLQQVDVGNPDREKFPEFEKARTMECTLAAGEALFIPKKWWHYVRAESMSFSVSYWWT